jgi:hypothetical protein
MQKAAIQRQRLESPRTFDLQFQPRNLGLGQRGVRQVALHDEAIADIAEVTREPMAPPPQKKKRPAGFI